MTKQVKTIQVKNKETGLVFGVPEGHFSLNSKDYEVVVPKKGRKPKAKASK